MTARHDAPKPIPATFCADHLRFVLACSEEQIEKAVAALPVYDLARLTRAVRKAADPHPPELVIHTGLAAHDGFAAHSHCIRSDHDGVPRTRD